MDACKKLMEDAGFEKFFGTFYTIKAGDTDVKNVKSVLHPHHFTPNGYRTVFIAQMYEGTDKEFWYVTSNIRGTFRGYRCRSECRDYDAGNIFASGKTAIIAVEKWLDNYKNLEYNISRR